MTVRIKKWGNSNGVLLSKEIMNNADLKTNDELDVYVDTEKNIVLKKPVKKFTVDELFANWDGEYVFSEEFDWGGPVGEEAW